MIRAVVAFCALAPVAVAAQPVEDEAARLFREGRELVEQGNVGAGCERFARSLDLDHEIGTELNLAACTEQLGHLRRAWELFEAAAGEADNDLRAGFARDRAAALMLRLATVTIVVEHPEIEGLTIEIDGRAVPATSPHREVVEPNDVEVTATAPGRIAFTVKVHANAGSEVAVVIPALAPPPPPSHRRIWMIGVGVLALATAVDIGFGLRAEQEAIDLKQRELCTSGSISYQHCIAPGVGVVDKAADAATFGVIAFGLIGATVAVYLAAPRDRITVVPTATASSGGVNVIGRF